MKKTTTLLLAFFSIAVKAQLVTISQGESQEQFLNRIAPANAKQVKFLLKDKFNTASEKIVYCYALFEEGNILNNTDSSLCFYVAMLSPVSGDGLSYNQQSFKTVCSYKKSTRLENAQVVELKKEKRLQAYVSEMVRGPGGVPRDVKRTFEYKQEMQGISYAEKFVEVELK